MAKTNISLIQNLRLKGFTLSEIVKETGYSKGTVSKYIRGINISNELQTKILEKKEAHKQIGNEFYKNTRAYIKRKELKRPNIKISNTLKSFTRGGLAERYAEYILLRAGFEVFTPNVITEACDLIVYTKTRSFRCEVKASVNDSIRIMHTLYSDGKYRSFEYTDEDRIDVFILVQLEEELISFIPAKELKGKTTVSVSGLGIFAKYLNSFEAFN